MPLAVAVDPASHRIFVTNADDDMLRVVDPTGGVVLRTVALAAGASYVAFPVAVDARSAHVFTGTTGAVSMADARTGALLRTVPVGRPLLALAVDGPRRHVLVVSRTDQTLYLLDARTGTVLRTRPIGATPLSIGMEARAGLAFISTPGNHAPGAVRVFATESGAHTRTRIIPVNEPFPYVGAIDESRQRVYVMTSPLDSVVVLDGRSGRVLRRIHVGMPTWAVAVDARRRRAYAVGACACLKIFDSANGTNLRTVPIGAAPYAVTVDESSGRVIVADSGGAEQVPDPWAWIPQGVRRRLPFLGSSGPRTRLVPPRILVLNDR